MSDPKVVIVHLRRPDQSNEKEMRSDPFYEFGSFGCTGCHDKNLMNPKNIKKLDGVRLAFAQGGPEGFKLIQLTPLVTVKSVKHGNRYELKWDKSDVFFKYKNAPCLIVNGKDDRKDDHSDFSFLKKILQKGKRLTGEGQFSSNFRSRCKPLEPDDAREIIKTYLGCVKTAKKEYFTRNYVETMHEPPPKPDNKRKETYQNLLRKAKTAKTCKGRCKKK
jgi:hypothetical protein